MRILVYPHSMELGGSQLNAVDLAREYARRGHQVTVVAEPGPLRDQLSTLGLPTIDIPLSRHRPSVAVMRTISRSVRDQSIDVVHAFEWPPILESWWSVGMGGRALVVGTIMSMSVADFIPRDVPLTLGTQGILNQARAMGFRHAVLLEPPIDVEANAPEFVADADPILPERRDGVVEVVIVSRLVPDLKGSGIREAIDSVRFVPNARLLVIGEGPMRTELQARADAVNADLGWQAVVLPGSMRDPRPAYARADVVLGMGGSALRAMAFAKPVVVAGELGFWRLADEGTMAGFSTTGWFGVGDGKSGVATLSSILNELLARPDRRRELGSCGRDWVVDRYSLTGAADVLTDWWKNFAWSPPCSLVRCGPAAVASLGGLISYKVGRRWQRWTGTARVDDFNAVVVGAPIADPPSFLDG